MIMMKLLAEALLTDMHSVYALGEHMCGENIPIKCEDGAVTASGEELVDDIPSAAIFIPAKYRMRPLTVCLKNPATGLKSLVRLNDKGNPRYYKVRGLDLNPQAYYELTGETAKVYSSIERLELC